MLLTAPSVSRAHAELRAFDGGWMLVDSGSQFGTYINGDRVREHRVTGRVTVQCGPAAAGSSFVLEATSVAPAPATPPPTPPTPPTPPAGGRPWAPPPAAGQGPGHTAVASEPHGTVVLPVQRSGPDLLVVAQGREHRVRHPAQLRVGRAPDCEVVVDDESCSRLHGVVSAVPGGWVYTDQSQQGSFENGRRLTTKQFDDRLDLRLGHPVAGASLSLVPVLSAAEEERRIARRRRRRTLLVAGAVAVVLALVASTTALAVALVRDDDPSAAPTGPAPSSSAPTEPGDQASPSATLPPTSGAPSLELLSADELDRAKAATVLLTADAPDDDGGRVSYSGSGSIISADGLILTNAHVAQPTAAGPRRDLRRRRHRSTPTTCWSPSSRVTTTHRRRPSTGRGRSRSTATATPPSSASTPTASGDPVDAADLALPTIDLGDSDELRSGDDVTVLGYPGISSSMRLTVTKGVISTFIDVPGLGQRSEIDTDARIAPGNSGGVRHRQRRPPRRHPVGAVHRARDAGRERPDPADQRGAVADRGGRAVTGRR